MAERLGAPLGTVHLQPLVTNDRLANPLIRPRSFRSARLNRATHALFRTVAWRSLGADTNTFRRSLGLPEVTRPVGARPVTHGLTDVHAYAPRLLPELPPGTPGYEHVTGFVHVPPAGRDRLGESDLDAWLAECDPPLSFGFGSMPLLDPPRTLALIARACRNLGRRGLGLGAQVPFRKLDDDRLERALLTTIAATPRAGAFDAGPDGGPVIADLVEALRPRA